MVHLSAVSFILYMPPPHKHTHTNTQSKKKGLQPNQICADRAGSLWQCSVSGPENMQGISQTPSAPFLHKVSTPFLDLLWVFTGLHAPLLYTFEFMAGSAFYIRP